MPYIEVQAGTNLTPIRKLAKVTAQRWIGIALLLGLTSIHAYGDLSDALVRVLFHHESEGVLYQGQFFPKTKIVHTAEFGGALIDSSGHTLCYVGNYWPNLLQRKPRIEIHTQSGKRYDARLIGVDERSGLAILKAASPPQNDLTLVTGSAPEGWRLVFLSDGRWKQFGPSALTLAADTSQGPREQRMIVPSPPRGLVSWEASWVLAGHARLAGVVARCRPYPFSRRLQECWMLPAKEIRDSLHRIGAERANIKAGWLGVILTQDREGVGIRGVVGGSPADRAGLLAGDVIRRVDGTAVNRITDLVRRIRWKTPGQQLAVGINRDDRTEEVQVKLAAHRPLSPQFVWGLRRLGSRLRVDPLLLPETLDLGVILESFQNGAGESSSRPQGGLLVKSILTGSPAQRAGLQAGDILTGIDGRAVDSAAELQKRLGAAPIPLRIQFLRGQRLQTREVKFDPKGMAPAAP